MKYEEMSKEKLISELKKTKLALEKSEGILDTMLLFSGDPMSMMDKDLSVIWANEFAKKIFGDDIVGKKWKDAFYNGIEPMEGCVAQKTFKDGKTREQYTQTTDKNGKIIHLHCTSSVALRDDDGNPGAVMETCRDVTELKKAEQTLQVAYHELKETQRQLVQSAKMAAVGQLAGGVAHEVKNPLAVIVHCANFLESQKKISDKDRLTKIRMIKEAAFKADKVVRSLLDFSKPRPITVKPCDMGKILENAIKLAGEELSLENVKVVKEIASRLPLINVDENQIEQLFINILLNAVEAMPKGGKALVKIYTKVLNELGHGVGRRETDSFKLGDTTLICEIEDTGAGVPEDIIDKVFDPFFTTKPAGQGAGLGLTIARSIVSGHRGHIHIESEKSRGSKVIIKLPLSK